MRNIYQRNVRAVPNLWYINLTRQILGMYFLRSAKCQQPKVQGLNNRGTLQRKKFERDGDVVDVDGISALHFPSLAAGEFHVAVRHRNHLGVMTKNPLVLGGEPGYFDFTNIDYDMYCYDQFSQVVINGKRSLWGGDLNHDGRLIFQGPGNDVYPLFTQVLFAPDNTALMPNFIATGYHGSDIDLDGYSIYMGPGNDKIKLFTEVMAKFYAICHPCVFRSNFVVIECLP